MEPTELEKRSPASFIGTGGQSYSLMPERAGRVALMAKPHLPPALELFRDRFNQGAYWESHEALEPEWRRTRSPFYHGLILYASAWVHHERKNPHGVKAQLAKAEPLLHPHAGGYLGVDVGGILRDSHALRDDVPPARPQIAFDPRRIRGDEPELAAAGD